MPTGVPLASSTAQGSMLPAASRPSRRVISPAT